MSKSNQELPLLNTATGVLVPKNGGFALDDGTDRPIRDLDEMLRPYRGEYVCVSIEIVRRQY